MATFTSIATSTSIATPTPIHIRTHTHMPAIAPTHTPNHRGL